MNPIVVLGATGSIGRQTLDVARHLELDVVGLAVNSGRSNLSELLEKWPNATLAVAGASSEEREALSKDLGSRVSFGAESVVEIAATKGATVVNGVVGSVGLGSSVAALEAGNRLALANKESLVAGGNVVKKALKKGGGELVPIDSEHSALFQLTKMCDAQRLVLTASGGPFRGRSRQEMENVTPEQALAHPTWRMGKRISVDSATMVNKGLEVIEANVLFGFGFDDIDVVVHPQSIVHSMVVTADGAFFAHMGITDMRVPIQYALTYPDRLLPPVPAFSPAGLTLTFEKPEREAFPALDLAYRAGEMGGTGPLVYNAADEVAVLAFLEGRLSFLGIPKVIERTLGRFEHRAVESTDEVWEADREARRLASALLKS